MAVRISLVPPLVVALAAGCKRAPYDELEPAQLQISSELVEFGELAQGTRVARVVTLSNSGQVALGIVSIEMASALDPAVGHPGSFQVDYDGKEVVPPDGRDTATGARSEPLPNVETGETGFVDTDVPDDTDTTDTDVAPDDGFAMVLPPGARVPVTITFSPQFPLDNHDAVVVTTADMDEEVGSDLPAHERIYRDADNSWQMVYVHGMGEPSAGNILVSPKYVDFGFVWGDQLEYRHIAVRNVGDGPLELNEVVVDPSCSAGFAVTHMPEPGTVVDGNTSTLIEVVYAPTEVAEARCRITIASSDVDNPAQDISLVANLGKNPANRSPTGVIHQPQPGYRHIGWQPIRLELTATDPDQPAGTLSCKVRSALQLGASIATCTPPDESGHFWMDLEIDGVLDAGLDVIQVQVTDDSGVTRRASIPVLINTAWPTADDDGDGFEPNASTHPDCNDADPGTYPFAAERHDGVDNDCDMRVDEGTDGADDDGDGMSEIEGDCDDNSRDTYRGAPEIQDRADNDCDGTIDEGTTVYDDDGDGFAELDLDCDDRDPLVNPSALEICDDGRDNNCNGLKDSQETCISADSKPMVVGGIHALQTAVVTGGNVQLAVNLFEADGDEVTHQWSVEGDAGEIDDPTAAKIVWTAPSELPPDRRDGAIYRVSYIGVDDDGNQVWDFAEIAVYPPGDLNRPILVAAEGKGCQTVPFAPASLLAGLGLLLAARRRRS